jgi:hypothetical protein
LLDPTTCPDLASSGWPFEKSPQGHHYANNKILQNVMRQWLQRRESNFNLAGICALAERWKKTVNKNGGYIEK